MNPKDGLGDALFDLLMSEEGDEAWAVLGDDTAAELLYEAVDPEPLDGVVGARLLASAARPAWADFIDRIGRLFQVGVDTAQDYCEALAGEGWTDVMPGVRLFHVQGGPMLTAANADVGFVELEEGVEFPWHEHLGQEVTLVLQGTLMDNHDNVVGPGEICELPGGTRHSFVAKPGGGTLLFAVTVYGVQFDDFADVPGHEDGDEH
jgi:quercetin dioxygenase-like cupin family protein